MNKTTAVGLVLMAVMLAALIGYRPTYAQLYGGGTGKELTTSPAELEECKKLGIPDWECNQQTILAARKLVKAAENQQNPYRGSGTSMLAQGLGDAAAFIGALVGIFGAISAAFFIMSFKGPRPQTTVTETTTAGKVTQQPSSDTKFCISCGAQLPAHATFCNRCGARQS